jgi:hypothetical protein
VIRYRNVKEDGKPTKEKNQAELFSGTAGQ